MFEGCHHLALLHVIISDDSVLHLASVESLGLLNGLCPRTGDGIV